MEKSIINNKGAVFYENGTWNFITKTVNRNNYTIEYEKKTGFSSVEKAKQAQEQESKRYQDQIVRVKSLTNMRYTFFEYLDYWYQKIYLPNSDSQLKIVYSWTIYNIIFPMAPKDILIGMVSSDYLNELLNSCKDYCKSAGPIINKVLNVSLKDAMDDGLISNDPLKNMKKYYWDVPAMIVYSKEQIKILLQAAYEYHSIYLEILLALFAGLRKGEIYGLKYSDFDPKTQTVKIERQITRDYEITVKNHSTFKIINSKQLVKPPKSLCSYRTLRIHNIIFHELEIRKKENMQLFEKLGKDEQEWKEYICIGKKGHIKSDGTCNEGLKRICERNALPRISMHDLRHPYVKPTTKKYLFFLVPMIQLS
ncbi:tyrosine-type recombinase/integrase [Parablautia sp. Marseille-Q6255]|uniref:tyrosine-type recombinase/integrase n=1 Tax=Parablautia sp. Marseille-Q6255 TaxID=3039593 RepID=UPI0024BC597B|nr:tyrosine-type recombinase/integrase [Parablautia sp. Marseille-Q6255]